MRAVAGWVCRQSCWNPCGVEEFPFGDEVRSRLSSGTEVTQSMARIQPVLSPVELALVDQMAELTGSKRTDVIKSALTVYHWFVSQTLTGSQVVARKPTGEEVALEIAELTFLDGQGNRLGPEELGVLAKRLAATSNPVEAARIKNTITSGFYGI